jgi:hypothetical protein
MNTAREGFDLYILDRSDLAAFDYKLGSWCSAAEKRHACLFFDFSQCGRVIAAVVDRSLYDFALASAARAIAATVRQRKALTKRSLQHSLARLGKKDMSARHDCDLMGHVLWTSQ